MMRTHGFHRKSGFAGAQECTETLGFPSDAPAQLCAQHCAGSSASAIDRPDALGEPLGINEVAKLIGCSPWTVRQRHLPQGLPHFRSGPNAKLIFYKNQVIRWLLRQQEKGGTSL